MHFHVGQETVPIDLVVSLQDRMHHIGAVIAVAQLDEAFRPDEFRRSDDAHGSAEDLDLAGMFEPGVADRHGAIRGREDHVEEILSLEDLAEPAVVLDLDRVTEILEMREHARVVAGLAEDIEILRRARNPRIGRERIGAGEQKGQPELVQLPEGFRVERFRLRVFEGRLGLGVHDGDTRVSFRAEIWVVNCHGPCPKRGQ